MKSTMIAPYTAWMYMHHDLGGGYISKSACVSQTFVSSHLSVHYTATCYILLYWQAWLVLHAFLLQVRSNPDTRDNG